tara:strand:+ start:34958 stop:36637 length:1680 start_codon:yes stop_codon:yes gene_type:complete
VSSVSDIIPSAGIADAEVQSGQVHWHAGPNGQLFELATLPERLCSLDVPFSLVSEQSQIKLACGGSIHFDANTVDESAYQHLAFVPKQSIQTLGNKQFCQNYGLKYPYMTGSMANGIASVELVEVIAKADMLASFGAAGLSLAEVEKAIQRLQAAIPDKPFCFNLIYSPNEKGHEDAIVDLYLRYGVDLVETSAYMKLTLPVVRYRVKGIHKDAQGNMVVPNRIIAKASRVELASKWFSPPPEKLLNELLVQGAITNEEAELAKEIPMAQDLTVEADSGGHTDNRPAITLLPTMLALRDQIQAEYNYAHELRVGAAGGIATPASALGAFAMGAAYIVTGTVNQACKESGSSDIVRNMLANTGQADVTMAPAVDMFEMGVKLQVLKRGSMFAMRGNKLYEIYKTYASIEEIPATDKANLEKTIFKMSLEDVWQKTYEFFSERDPSQVEKANQDPKHKMALIFRWYLGLSSRWANAGVEDRQVDYQVWCGPAMGAFNEWTKGTFLATPDQRDAVTVAMNIMYGAAILSRANGILKQGVALAGDLIQFQPMQLDAIEKYLSE